MYNNDKKKLLDGNIHKFTEWDGPRMVFIIDDIGRLPADQLIKKVKIACKLLKTKPNKCFVDFETHDYGGGHTDMTDLTDYRTIVSVGIIP